MKKILVVILAQSLLQASGILGQEQAKVVKEGTPASYWSASLAAERAGNLSDALSQTQLFARSGGDAYLSNLRRGWLAYLLRDSTSAEAGYQAASRLESNALSPLIGLLNVAVQKADDQAILKAAQRVLKVDGTNLRAWLAQGEVAWRARQIQQMASFYSKALVYWPESDAAKSGKAWALLYLNQKSEAKKLFLALLETSPYDPLATEGLRLANSSQPIPLP